MYQSELFQDQVYYEFYAKDANKELVVLIHPLGMNREVWSETISALADHYAILVIDLPGHGKSTVVKENSQWEISDLARMTQALAASLGYQKAHYVGTSIGGAIGQELLLSFPEFLQSLMVTNTSHQIGTKESWAQRATDVRLQGLQNMAAKIVPRWFAKDYLTTNVKAVASWQRALEESDNESYATLCEALGNWSATERLAKAQKSIPVLVVAGGEDPAMPVENMQQLAKLMQAPLEIMDIGHVPSVEDPIGFNHLLVNWLQQSQ